MYICDFMNEEVLERPRNILPFAVITYVMELPLNLYNPQLYSEQKEKNVANTTANKSTSQKIYRSVNRHVQMRNAEKQLGDLNLDTANQSAAAIEIPPWPLLLPQKHQPNNNDFSFAEEPSSFAQPLLHPFKTSLDNQGETTLNTSNNSYEPFKKQQQKKLPPKKPEFVRRIASDDEDCKRS